MRIGISSTPHTTEAFSAVSKALNLDSAHKAELAQVELRNAALHAQSTIQTLTQCLPSEEIP